MNAGGGGTLCGSASSIGAGIGLPAEISGKIFTGEIGSIGRVKVSGGTGFGAGGMAGGITGIFIGSGMGAGAAGAGETTGFGAGGIGAGETGIPAQGGPALGWGGGGVFLKSIISGPPARACGSGRWRADASANGSR